MAEHPSEQDTLPVDETQGYKNALTGADSLLGPESDRSKPEPPFDQLTDGEADQADLNQDSIRQFEHRYNTDDFTSSPESAFGDSTDTHDAGLLEQVHTLSIDAKANTQASTHTDTQESQHNLHQTNTPHTQEQDSWDVEDGSESQHETFQPEDVNIDWWGLKYDNVNEQLICPICQTAFVDPQTTTCGHTFCLQCLSAAQEMHIVDSPEKPFRCPVDRVSIGEGDVLPASYVVHGLVNDLIVTCPYAEQGCTFHDKRWLLESHLKQRCKYVEGPCVAGCSKTAARHWRSTGTCPHELIACPEKCGAKIETENVDKHLREQCRSVRWVCPDCGVVSTVASRNSHTKTCTEARVACPGAGFGCRWTTNRSDSEGLESHSTNCALALMAPTLNAQNKKIAGLERQNRSLKDQLATTRRQIRQDAVELDMNILLEYERLRRDLDHASRTTENNVKQLMMLTRENLRMTEDIAFLRNGVSQLHHQVHADRRMVFGLNRPRPPNARFSWTGPYGHAGDGGQSTAGADEFSDGGSRPSPDIAGFDAVRHADGKL